MSKKEDLVKWKTVETITPNFPDGVIFINNNKNKTMSTTPEQIFLLATKKSQKYEGTTYCVGVYKLGTPNIEFIMGETDTDREYQRGDEVSYIYNADYTSSLQNALDWLNNVK